MLDCMSELGDDGIIAWYPSAGDDARAVLELGEARRRLHGFEHRPTLLIHTSLPVRRYCAHNDSRTHIGAVRRENFDFAGHLRNNDIKDAYFDDREPAQPSRGSIELVEGTSRQYGKSRLWVLNFELSNWDFFLSCVARHGLRFHTLIRVREGAGLGGCCFSSSYFFPWLYWAGCREIITDHMVFENQDNHGRVCKWMKSRGQTTAPPRFGVHRSGEPFRWSELNVDAWTLKPEDGTFDRFEDWANTVSQWSDAQRQGLAGVQPPRIRRPRPVITRSRNTALNA
jgi:hypothetical protein